MVSLAKLLRIRQEIGKKYKNMGLEKFLLSITYSGNELEITHYGPKFEADKDDTLNHYLRDVVRRHQISLLDLRHLRFRPSCHPTK